MEGLEEARRKWFEKMSQRRASRRLMAKKLGFMKNGWQNVKEQFPPVNRPIDLGISEFKRVLKETPLSTSDKNKAVLQYKEKAYSAINNIINKEA